MIIGKEGVSGWPIPMEVECKLCGKIIPREESEIHSLIRAKVGKIRVKAHLFLCKKCKIKLKDVKYLSDYIWFWKGGYG